MAKGSKDDKNPRRQSSITLLLFLPFVASAIGPLCALRFYGKKSVNVNVRSFWCIIIAGNVIVFSSLKKYFGKIPETLERAAKFQQDPRWLRFRLLMPWCLPFPPLLDIFTCVLLRNKYFYVNQPQSWSLLNTSKLTLRWVSSIIRT